MGRVRLTSPMSTAPDPEPITETLRVLITTSDRKLTQIAFEAGVDYQRLYRWFNGKTETLDANMAESVYKALTGKTFTRP